MEKIRIPKVDPDGLYTLYINKGKIITSIKKEYAMGGVQESYYVTLKAQEIQGVKIPAGITMWVQYINEGTGPAQCHITGKQLNGLLRTLYLDTLRKK